MKNRFRLNIFIGVFVVLVVLILTLIAFRHAGYLNSFKVDTSKLGHFGDFIGGFLGVLLTSVATILIYLTYFSQKEELKLSRELFSKQNFENTFFNMLKVHQGLKNHIAYIQSEKNAWCGNYLNIEGNVPKKIPYSGRQFFKLAEEEFRCFWKYENPEYFDITDLIAVRHKKYGYKLENHPKIKVYDPADGQFVNHSVEEHLSFITELKYPFFWDQYKYYLGDYFRNIYNILKYISESKQRELNQKKKSVKEEEEIKEKYKNYADILQSQLSLSELFLNFYNALMYPNMKRYIEEFDFIENLYVSNLLHPKHAEFKGMGRIKRH